MSLPAHSDYSLVFLGFWVGESCINEFTSVVFGEEVGSNGVGDSEEVLHVMDGIADVGVKVILEVLKHVHVLADKVISSGSQVLTWSAGMLLTPFFLRALPMF